MNNNYTVRNVYNESGETFNDLISKFLISFLEKNFNENTILLRNKSFK